MEIGCLEDYKLFIALFGIVRWCLKYFITKDV